MARLSPKNDSRLTQRLLPWPRLAGAGRPWRASLVAGLVMVAFGMIISDQLHKETAPTMWLHSSSPLTVVTAPLVLLAAVAGLFSVKSGASKIGLLLLAAGGASNVLDRLVWGGIRNPLSVGSFYFNGADILIIAGVALIVALREPRLEI